MEIFNKMLLGIILAAPIGPVSVEMIRRGLKNGFLSAFIVRLGAAIGNLSCLIIAYYGILQLHETSFIITGLSLISSLILIHSAYSSIANTVSFNSPTQHDNNGIIVGFYLSIANPIAFIFWSGIMTNSSNIYDSGLLINLLIIVGVIIWGAIFSLILSLGKKYAPHAILLYINKIAGALMLYYGISFLWNNLYQIFFIWNNANVYLG